MFYTSTNPCQNMDFLSPSSSWYCCGFLCSSVKSDLSTDLCHWYSQPSIGWLHQVQSTVHCDYTKNRSVFNRVENSLHIHSTEKREYDVASEYNYHVESVYWFHRGEICTWNEDKDKDKISVKNDTNAIITHCRMSDRAIEACKLCT